MKSLLEIEKLNITFEFNGQIVNAVKDSSFRINKGECLAIVGESGPELMVAKQDVNIIPNEDIKFVPPSVTKTAPITNTIVRTIVQQKGRKIVNRTRRI